MKFVPKLAKAITKAAVLGMSLYALGKLCAEENAADASNTPRFDFSEIQSNVEQEEGDCQ